MMKHVCSARGLLAALVIGAVQVAATPAHAALFTENFDDITTLAGSGWVQVNNSSPAGTNWFQGNTGIFNAQSGAPDSYIASNFGATGPGLGGNISNWLILPELSLSSSDTFSFFARAGGFYPDRLEVRFASGNSTNVGATDTSVGDFTTLLMTINPALGGPVPGDWTNDWVQFNVSLAGLGSATSGRLAFRYFVPDTNTNGDYIGIDSVQLAQPVPEPATLTLLGLGLAGLAGQRRRRATIERTRAQRGA